ncbi:FtsX-like permease family protein [Catellatospora tritici]|uniref:FtsX-like permease family protein n=1 Tax=Catellatospora tritici TaxID=2851566 RepID=UPI001C2D239D|nr:FtsX-like permease family protein [Catellatospora tritici]MBV1855947.1 ABC transporter permease [Catellatospora tritici]
MIRFGLRLAVTGGREAFVRLAVIAAAVALGTGLLLATVASLHAVDKQTARYGWMTTRATESAPVAGVDPLYWALREDFHESKLIGRLDVAATGPAAPVPPGLPRLPGPGEYFASPKLAELLAATPADQLGARYPGHLVGTIGRDMVPDPDTMLIVIGHAPEELAVLGAGQVTSIGTEPPGARSAGLDLVLSTVAGGLLFPVLIFIGTATRLNAARREQRFAAMRLVGATPRQVSVIAAIESTAAAFIGTALGFALYALGHDTLASIPFTGSRFYPDEVAVTGLDALLVGLGVPLAAAVAARLALRRVRISPLGVTRRVTPRPPRAYRLIPLALGLAELTYFIGRRPQTSQGQVAAFLPGLLVIMAGLVIAGPYLTMVGARLLARRANRPATLIAARRLADNPQAAFRAVSGLMLALFVTSTAVGIITTIVAERGTKHGTTASAGSMHVYFHDGDPLTTVPETISARLRDVPGVGRMITVRHNPVERTGSGPDDFGSLPGVISCAELDPVFGRCAPGAVVAEVWSDLIGFPDAGGPDTVWAASTVTPEQYAQLPLMSLVVRTDGSTAAVERARTILEVGLPQYEVPPMVAGDFEADFTNTLTGWKQLANVIILASLPIAGCSLAVSIVGGLSERKRPFSLLRLSGVPLRTLRRVVALESTVPLVVVAVVAIGAGLLSAQLFLTAQMHYDLRAPSLGYYLTVLAGLVGSLAIIGSTLPLLRRITGPETARNE